MPSAQPLRYDRPVIHPANETATPPVQGKVLTAKNVEEALRLSEMNKLFTEADLAALKSGPPAVLTKPTTDLAFYFPMPRGLSVNRLSQVFGNRKLFPIMEVGPYAGQKWLDEESYLGWIRVTRDMQANVPGKNRPGEETPDAVTSAAIILVANAQKPHKLSPANHGLFSTAVTTLTEHQFPHLAARFKDGRVTFSQSSRLSWLEYKVLKVSIALVQP